MQSRAGNMWIYMNGTYSGTHANHMYDSYYGEWYYLQPASTYNVVNMNTGLWYPLEGSFIRYGWSYWALPWIYCAYTGTWYWMDMSVANWAYDYYYSRWLQLGSGWLF